MATRPLYNLAQENFSETAARLARVKAARAEKEKQRRNSQGHLVQDGIRRASITQADAELARSHAAPVQDRSFPASLDGFAIVKPLPRPSLENLATASPSFQQQNPHHQHKSTATATHFPRPGMSFPNNEGSRDQIPARSSIKKSSTTDRIIREREPSDLGSLGTKHDSDSNVPPQLGQEAPSRHASPSPSQGLEKRTRRQTENLRQHRRSTLEEGLLIDELDQALINEQVAAMTHKLSQIHEVLDLAIVGGVVVGSNEEDIAFRLQSPIHDTVPAGTEEIFAPEDGRRIVAGAPWPGDSEQAENEDSAISSQSSEIISNEGDKNVATKGVESDGGGIWKSLKERRPTGAAFLSSGLELEESIGPAHPPPPSLSNTTFAKSNPRTSSQKARPRSVQRDGSSSKKEHTMVHSEESEDVLGSESAHDSAILSKPSSSQLQDMSEGLPEIDPLAETPDTIEQTMFQRGSLAWGPEVEADLDMPRLQSLGKPSGVDEVINAIQSSLDNVHSIHSPVSTIPGRFSQALRDALSKGLGGTARSASMNEKAVGNKQLVFTIPPSFGSFNFSEPGRKISYLRHMKNIVMTENVSFRWFMRYVGKITVTKGKICPYPSSIMAKSSNLKRIKKKSRP